MQNRKEKSGIGCGIILALAATWYACTCKWFQKPIEQRYNLPAEIRVIETDLPYEKRESKSIVKLANGEEKEQVTLEKIIKTKDIDFSKDFQIKTDRYRFVKDKDWIPSRIIGHIASIPGKIYFFDWDYGWGQDKDRTRAALSMLEENKDIKDLTLRLNHNEAFYDMYRMFTEKKLRDRNNFLARATLGVVLSVGDEIWAEFARGSYYNPLTKTVVCYSNIESITAHELGHHQDFQRFDSDWGYMLGRILPPVMLYQEWKASTNAKNQILSKDDSWQFYRYLIPAFFTYIMGTYKTIKKIKKVFSED
jgi:hypothetical protein